MGSSLADVAYILQRALVSVRDWFLHCMQRPRYISQRRIHINYINSRTLTKTRELALPATTRPPPLPGASMLAPILLPSQPYSQP